MDYAAPRADIVATMFNMEMDESTPCKNNPLGVKGVGELGTIGATPAIVNAVADALARNGLAGRTPHLHMPLTPARGLAARCDAVGVRRCTAARGKSLQRQPHVVLRQRGRGRPRVHQVVELGLLDLLRRTRRCPGSGASAR